MRQLFASGGQSIQASASSSVLPINVQGQFLLEFTGLISLYSKEFQESSPAPHFESISSSVLSLLYGPTLTSDMTAGKTIALTLQTFVSEVMALFLI